MIRRPRLGSPSGKIHLRSNVNLHLAKGAVLRFSDDPQDYLPAVQTSWEGIECYNYSPLIYAFGCENVAITGQGRIQPVLDRWSIWSARPKPHMDALVVLYDMAYRNVPVAQCQMAVGANNLRPHLIQFNRCRQVLVEDIAIEGSPFWTLHPLLCRDVVIRRIAIRAHGHNNDGVDPEMSQNVLVDDCHFIGDGRGADDHAVPIDNLLFVKTNERRGRFVRNIHMRHVSATTIAGGVLAVDTDVLYQWRTLLPTYVRRLTPIAGLYVSDVDVRQAKCVASIRGAPGMPVRDVRLDRVTVATTTGTPIVTQNVTGFTTTGGPPADRGSVAKPTDRSLNTASPASARFLRE